MGFWSEATDQAGRQFGARYWRWFTFVRVARALAPWLGLVVILGAGVWLYRLVMPDWSAIGQTALAWLPETLLVLGIGAVLTLAGWGGTAVWRANSWRWGRY